VRTADAIVIENEAARLAGLRAGLCPCWLGSPLLAVFVSRGLPTRQSGVVVNERSAAKASSA
jgi:hypothetical protein